MDAPSFIEVGPYHLIQDRRYRLFYVVAPDGSEIPTSLKGRFSSVEAFRTAYDALGLNTPDVKPEGLQPVRLGQYPTTRQENEEWEEQRRTKLKVEIGDFVLAMDRVYLLWVASRKDGLPVPAGLRGRWKEVADFKAALSRYEAAHPKVTKAKAREADHAS